MGTLQIAILAVLQGLTEFIPVSSSGHLIIISKFLSSETGAEEIGTVIVFLHLGTLLAVLLHYRKFIFEILNGILKREQKALITSRNIIITSIPVFIFGLLFTVFVEENLSRNAQFFIACIALIITGSLFIFSERSIKRLYDRSLTSDTIDPKRAFIIGLFQSVGILYGVSRSGITLLGSRLQNMSNKDSLDYAFLVSIPVLIAASSFTLITELESVLESVSIENIILGIVISAVTGYASIAFLLSFLRKRSLRVFGIYCLGFGIISLILNFVIN